MLSDFLAFCGGFNLTETGICVFLTTAAIFATLAMLSTLSMRIRLTFALVVVLTFGFVQTGACVRRSVPQMDRTLIRTSIKHSVNFFEQGFAVFEFYPEDKKIPTMTFVVFRKGRGLRKGIMIRIHDCDKEKFFQSLDNLSKKRFLKKWKRGTVLKNEIGSYVINEYRLSDDGFLFGYAYYWTERNPFFKKFVVDETEKDEFGIYRILKTVQEN